MQHWQWMLCTLYSHVYVWSSTRVIALSVINMVCIEAVEGSQTILPHNQLTLASCPFYLTLPDPDLGCRFLVWASQATEAVDLFILFDIDQNGQIDHGEFLRQVFPEEYVQDKQYMLRGVM